MKMTDKDTFLKHQKALTEARKASQKVKILVGLGTCGIAAGAQEVYDALEEGQKRGELKDTELVKVGCVGYCHAEPTVELLFPDGKSILLGYIHADTASEVITGYISTKHEGKHSLEKKVAKNVMEV